MELRESFTDFFYKINPLTAGAAYILIFIFY